MIATHNVNVNGTWYKAGDVIPEAKQQKVAEPVKEVPAEEKPETEAPNEVPRTRTATTRRKNTGK